MKFINFVFTLFIVIIFAILILWGVMFLVSKASVILQQSTPFSPFEDGVDVVNNENCTDGDGGVFSSEKGEVSHIQKFLFFRWASVIQDECNGDLLTEYYCSQDGIGSGVFECEAGCVEGKCIETISAD